MLTKNIFCCIINLEIKEKVINNEIDKLNKKLGAKSPIQFEISYGISVGDKTSNIYAAILLKKLPEEIDAKYFNKMEKLFN